MKLLTSARFWFGVLDTTFTLAAGAAMATSQWGYMALFMVVSTAFAGAREIA